MSSFFAELKRRNVFRVAVAYAIVAWLIAQIINVINEPLNLPDWFDTVIIVLLGVGFLLAIFLAWVYELTPEGIKKTTDVTTGGNFAHETTHKFNYIVTVLLALAVVFLIIDNYILQERDNDKGVIAEEPSTDRTNVKAGRESTAVNTIPSPASNTIAVLPFINLSSDSEQDYFADGLTEELLNKLAQVKDLQVTARTSSFFFKGKNEDIRKIGEMLGVAYLLEGSVNKSGNQLRITAQLIKAHDRYHLWSGTFDRPLADVFVIQDDIAKAVTRALSITLGVGAFNRPGMTKNVAAYEEYLQVIADININTKESILSAIDHAEYAVRLDPEFGLGWLSVRNAYNAAASWLPSEQAVDFGEKMTSARQRAETIDPNMPELRLVRAQDYELNHNWLEAESTFKKMQGDYTTAEVNEAYGMMLISTGRTRDGIPYLQHAKRLNPLSVTVSASLAMAFYNSSEFSNALSEVDRGRTLEVQNLTFPLIEWFIALERKNRERASEIMLTKWTNPADPDEGVLRLSELLKIDDRVKALTEYHEYLNNYAGDSLSPINNLIFAHVASALGDPELALTYYQESFVNPTVSIGSAFWHPHQSSMRKLPGFKSLVSDVGLVEYWRKVGNWGDYCHPVGDEDFECE